MENIITQPLISQHHHVLRIAFPSVLWGDIDAYGSIGHIVIFGEPGWNAVNSLKYNGISIKQYFEARRIKLLRVPHFAQNYQQRKIYIQPSSADENLFQIKPNYRPYQAKAACMRQEMIAEVNKLRAR